jgi:uncharacterized protein
MMTDQSCGGTRLNMLDQGEATLLRVFIGNDDTYEDVPLSEAIVREAKRVGVAGATVLRGLLGYGASSAIHRYDGFFSRDLPIVVEIIDTEDKITSFLPLLERMMRSGLVTTQQLRIVRALQKNVPAGTMR